MGLEKSDYGAGLSYRVKLKRVSARFLSEHDLSGNRHVLLRIVLDETRQTWAPPLASMRCG